MAIHIHCFLLLLTLLMPFGLLLPTNADTRPTIGRAISAAMPFLAIGIVSILLLNVRGHPFIEWLLPAIVCVLIAVLARNRHLYTWLKRALVVLAIALWFSFMHLIIGCDYARNQKQTKRMLDPQQRTFVLSAEKWLAEKFPDPTVIPQGNLADLLGQVPFENCFLWSFEDEWHTRFTDLVLVKKHKALFWHLGSGKVELRPIE